MNILIIKLAALGDIVTASTMIAVIKEKYPDAKVTWLCDQTAIPLVRSFKGVDTIVPVDMSLVTKGKLNQVRFVLSVWKKFLNRSFDIIFNAHSDKRYKYLTMGIRSKKVHKFNARYNIIPGRYHGDEYARLVAEHDNFIIKSYPLAEINTPETEKNNTIFLLPGGARNLMSNSDLRRWPLDYYVKLAEKLTESGEKVALIGGKDDLWVLEAFKKLKIRSYIGNTDINELIVLLKGAKCLVAHDSGPVYICRLVGTPVVSLFGPLMAKTRLNEEYLEMSISAKEPCSPCYDGKNYASCDKNICMHNISVDTVFNKLKTLRLI